MEDTSENDPNNNIEVSIDPMEYSRSEKGFYGVLIHVVDYQMKRMLYIIEAKLEKNEASGFYFLPASEIRCVSNMGLPDGRWPTSCIMDISIYFKPNPDPNKTEEDEEPRETIVLCETMVIVDDGTFRHPIEGVDNQFALPIQMSDNCGAIKVGLLLQNVDPLICGDEYVNTVLDKCPFTISSVSVAVPIKFIQEYEKTVFKMKLVEFSDYDTIKVALSTRHPFISFRCREFDIEVTQQNVPEGIDPGVWLYSYLKSIAHHYPTIMGNELLGNGPADCLFRIDKVVEDDTTSNKIFRFEIEGIPSLFALAHAMYTEFGTFFKIGFVVMERYGNVIEEDEPEVDKPESTNEFMNYLDPSRVVDVEMKEVQEKTTIRQRKRNIVTFTPAGIDNEDIQSPVKKYMVTKNNK